MVQLEEEAMRRLLLLTMLMRVWWGEGPTANGIFLGKKLMAYQGRWILCDVVRRGSDVSVVPDSDIIKIDTVEEKS